MTCHKNARFFFIALFLLLYEQSTFSWPTLARNDPYPMYTSIDPQAFLSMRERELIRGNADEKGSTERLMLSFSPYGQNAYSGKLLSGTYEVPTTGTPTTCNVVGPSACNPVEYPSTACFNNVRLGDMDGIWYLLGLLSSPLPANTPFPPALANAAQQLFAAPTPVAPASLTVPPIAAFPFGYVSIPLKYRKRGVRWDIELQLCGGFGFQFQGGITEISQVLNCSIQNLTPSGSTGTPTGDQVNQYLFDQLSTISQQINYNICNFTKVGWEDLYFCLYWRHLFPVNFNRDMSWPRLIVIPFARLAGSAATGKEKDPTLAFSLPFGNNGHESINANVGINLDFSETVEIGGEVGYSHFFGKDFDKYRLPNSYVQSGIFPYMTSVHVQPGDDFYLAAKLAAYHFLDRLSCWVQWVYVNHKQDKIEQVSPDTAFLTPNCPNTAWRTQFANIAFNYDVSPSISLGFLWQQPLHVRNAYNSTTVMLNLNLVF